MASSHSNHNDDELLSAYVDNELTADQRAVVEERLRTDERAQQLVAQLRAASDAIKSLPRVSLGRDLRSSVLNAIARHTPAAADAHAEEPTILSLPESTAKRRPRGARPLLWAAFATAAALLIMAVREPDQPVDDRSVAVNTGSSEKKLEADAPVRGPNSISADERNKDAASTLRTEGITRSASAPSILNGGNEPRSRGVAESEAMRPSAAPLAADDQKADKSPAEAIGEPAPAREMLADEAVSSPGLMRTYNLTIADDAGVEAFVKLLAEHHIALNQDEAELPAKLKVELEPLMGDQLARRRDVGGALKAGTAKAVDAAAEAVLVEASPDDMAALVAALGADRGKFQDLEAADRLTLEREAPAAQSEVAAVPAAAAPAATMDAATATGASSNARGGGFGGGGGGGIGGEARGTRGAGRGGLGAGGRGVSDAGAVGRDAVDGQSRLGRAWRFSFTPPQSGDLLQLRAAEEAPQGAAGQIAGAPASAAGSAPSGGEQPSTTSPSSSAPVRALFLLRRTAK